MLVFYEQESQTQGEPLTIHPDTISDFEFFIAHAAVNST